MHAIVCKAAGIYYFDPARDRLLSVRLDANRLGLGGAITAREPAAAAATEPIAPVDDDTPLDNDEKSKVVPVLLHWNAGPVLPNDGSNGTGLPALAGDDDTPVDVDVDVVDGVDVVAAGDA